VFETTAVHTSTVVDVEHEAAVDGLGLMIRLARRIRHPCATIGYETFLLLALLKRIRVFCWEGGARIDVVAVYAPWASHLLNFNAIADAIACKYEVHDVTGEVLCKQISEDVQLEQCNHFVAAIHTSTVVDVEQQAAVGVDVESWCRCRGLAIVYTVADGDRGIDTMCVMIGADRSRSTTDKLR
jgi:hypothetical protein